MGKILKVTSVKTSLTATDPPKLVVEAEGIVATPGWKNIDLVAIEGELSDDGIFDIEFTGTPPEDMVIQVIRPVTGDLVIYDDVAKIVGVQVHARTNSVTSLIADWPPFPPDQPEADISRFTTLAIGEEKLPVGEKTFHFGEEGKTIVGGEEKLPVGEKTFHFGEEGKSIVGGEEKIPVGETLPGGESGPTEMETAPGLESGSTFFGENTIAGEDFSDIVSSRIRTPFNRR